MVEDVGQENVIPAGDRVRVEPIRLSSPAALAETFVAEGLRVVSRTASGGAAKDLSTVIGTPGVAAGGIDRHLRAALDKTHAGGVLVPLAEALLPFAGGAGGELVGRLPGGDGGGVVHPGAKVAGFEVRESEGEVPQIALRINADRRHAVDRSLFQQAQTEARSCRSRSSRRRPHGSLDRESRTGNNRPPVSPVAGIVLPAEIKLTERLVSGERHGRRGGSEATGGRGTDGRETEPRTIRVPAGGATQPSAESRTRLRPDVGRPIRSILLDGGRSSRTERPGKSENRPVAPASRRAACRATKAAGSSAASSTSTSVASARAVQGCTASPAARARAANPVGRSEVPSAVSTAGIAGRSRPAAPPPRPTARPSNRGRFW